MSRLFILPLLALPLSGIFVSYTVLASPPKGDECVFPNDCLRHGLGSINIGMGTCVSSSAWKERYIHATPDERRHMWDERGKNMDERIFDAYELTETQREICDRIDEESTAEWRRGMGATFEEARGLRRQFGDRIEEGIYAALGVIRGTPGAVERWEKVPRLEDDHEAQRLRQRLKEIDREYPIDWSGLADKIENALPPEQARRGRERLAAKMPFTISKRHGEKLGVPEPVDPTGDADTAEDVDGVTSIDRWGAYVRTFTARYQPTLGQSNAIASILEETRRQDAKLIRAMRADVDRYEAAGKAEWVRRRREVFQFDQNDLFNGFQTRLESLLTTAQKQTTTTSK